MKTKIIARTILVAVSVITLHAAAQVRSPLERAKDALKKAKHQLQQGQPQEQPQAQQSATAQPQPAGSSSQPAGVPGQHWWLCQYFDQKDPNKPELGSRRYFSLLPSNAPLDAEHSKDFIAYVQRNYKLTDIARNPSGYYNGTAGGYCNRISDAAAARTNSMDSLQKQWSSSTPKIEAIEVNFAATLAQAAIVTATPTTPTTPAAAVPRPTTPATGGPFISCSTGGGEGVDTYLTGVFQTTRPVKHSPSGGNLVDQSVLDDFYAYLKQKGYTFKPGSNYGCDVTPTEAGTKAAQHKRAYEGGGCSTCGKIVETGWKDTP
jgi:hypothetical protein